MDKCDYPDSWYRATMDPAALVLRLRAGHDCDVCVIGAGLAGLTTALELARRGKAVIILEARRCGWGASGRNGGFVLGGFAQSDAAIMARAGPDDAKALHVLARGGAEYVRAMAGQLDRALVTGTGFLSVSRVSGSDEAGAVTGAKLRSYVRSPDYFSGVYDPSGFHIHPLNYVLALAGEARARGVEIFENSAVRAIEKTGRGFTLSTGSGQVLAGAVVLCTSAGGAPVYRRLDRAILPVATHVITTAPLGPVLDEAVITRAAIADTRRAGDYYRRIGESRVMWGGRITTRVTPPHRLGQLMARDMGRVFPQLGPVPVAHVWSGVMGYARHKMPLIGELEPGLWVASAFGGHGLNTTAMAGELIASAMADGDDRWRLFSRYGTRWGGGPFARAGVQAVYWFMQAADAASERRARGRARGNGAGKK